ncbi:MAG: helix-turn-helix domain-containing protein [Aureispira sp.]|nr:helix-turn-helix domain-containing protein [Aureispira sp.]
MHKSSIKEYQISATGIESTFQIKRMEDIYDNNNGQTDEPHRHNYYTILWSKEAQGVHRIDFKEYTLKDHHVFFISPGQVHQLITTARPIGWGITFSKDFLIQNNIQTSFISDINLFGSYGDSPPLALSMEIEAKLATITTDILSYLEDSQQTFKYEAVGALLKLFLINCHSACAVNSQTLQQQTHVGIELLRRFRALVDLHYQKEHKVSFYAKQLAISSDYLNKNIKTLTGKSAKEFIQTKITTEAKRLLIFTTISTKELAYTLGFEEPSNFSNFFKNCTGQSPSAFKKQHS